MRFVINPNMWKRLIVFGTNITVPQWHKFYINTTTTNTEPFIYMYKKNLYLHPSCLLIRTVSGTSVIRHPGIRTPPLSDLVLLNKVCFIKLKITSYPSYDPFSYISDSNTRGSTVIKTRSILFDLPTISNQI